MSVHISEVIDYLDAYPLCCYEGSLCSFMEMLHNAYTQYNFIDSEKLKDFYIQLEKMEKRMTAEDIEEIDHLVSKIAMEHEILGFTHGIRLGMLLMTEINYYE